jgi:hypothetical protein
MTQTPTALQLWQEFRHHLTVEITVDIDPDASGGNANSSHPVADPEVIGESPTSHPEPVEGPAVLTLTIANTAPTEENHPKILFFDIKIEHKGKAQPRSRFNSMSMEIPPGDTHEFLYDLKYSDIPAFSATVTAQVSRRELFKLTTTAIPPAQHTQPAIRNYLNERVVSEAESHLAEIFKSSMEWLPDANTTIADMPAKLDHLNNVEEAIKTFLKDFNAVKAPFATNKDNPIFLAVAEVTKHALRNLELLRRAANNNDPEALTTAT